MTPISSKLATATWGAGSFSSSFRSIKNIWLWWIFLFFWQVVVLNATYQNADNIEQYDTDRGGNGRTIVRANFPDRLVVSSHWSIFVTERSDWSPLPCQDLCPEIEEHEHNSGVKMAGTVYFPVEVGITFYGNVFYLLLIVFSLEPSWLWHLRECSSHWDLKKHLPLNSLTLPNMIIARGSTNDKMLKAPADLITSDCYRWGHSQIDDWIVVAWSPCSCSLRPNGNCFKFELMLAEINKIYFNQSVIHLKFWSTSISCSSVQYAHLHVVYLFLVCILSVSC